MITTEDIESTGWKQDGDHYTGGFHIKGFRLFVQEDQRFHIKTYPFDARLFLGYPETLEDLQAIMRMCKIKGAHYK